MPPPWSEYQWTIRGSWRLTTTQGGVRLKFREPGISD